MKRNRKYITFLVLIIFLFGMLNGCGTNTKEDKFYDENDAIQVIDNAGRKVSFSEPVQTVATSWGGGVDMYLYALGVGDRIAATNSKHGIDKLFFDPEKMPKVGKWALDKEALAEVSPDLFLHGGYALDYLQGANQVGVRAYGMGFNSFEDIQENITNLGKIFNVEDRAEYVNQYCESIMSLVESRTKNLETEKRPSVVILGAKTGELASDIYDTVETMITKAGGISCTPDEIAKKTETTIVGLETIFNWNPDYIFMQDYYCELTAEEIMQSDTWKPLEAVKNGYVYEIPSEIDAWCKGNPSCYLGTLYMSMKMYPELYEDIDIKKVAEDFYQEVYGLDLTYKEIGIK